MDTPWDYVLTGLQEVKWMFYRLDFRLATDHTYHINLLK